MIKFTFLLTRKPSLTHEQFVDHHRNVHADLFMSVSPVQANVRRDVQQHALSVKLPGLPPVKYDGITELWFDDVDSIAKVFTDPLYLGRIGPDEASFLDLERRDLISSKEHPVSPAA